MNIVLYANNNNKYMIGLETNLQTYHLSHLE